MHLLAQDLAEVGLAPEGMVAAYDAATEAAQQAFEASVPAAGAFHARDLLRQAAEARATTGAALAGAGPRRRESALDGDGLILPAGAEDPETDNPRCSRDDVDPLISGDRVVATPMTKRVNLCNPIAKGKRKSPFYVKMCWGIIFFSVFVSGLGVANFVKIIIDL